MCCVKLRFQFSYSITFWLAYALDVNRAETQAAAAPAPVSIPFLMPILLLRALAFFAAPNFCTGKRKHFIKKLLFYLPRDRERVREGGGERGNAFVRGLWRKFTHRNMILHLLLILTLAIIFWPGLPCRAAVYSPPPLTALCHAPLDPTQQAKKT